MPPALVYKLVIVDGDKEILSMNLSYSSVGAILNDLPDLAEHGDLYQVAAKHPSRQVRAQVAQKETISAALCNVLANDASIDVLRNLISNKSFGGNATIELLEKLIERDVEIADRIAGFIRLYPQADLSKLAVLISGHSDPEVLVTLAQGRRKAAMIARRRRADLSLPVHDEKHQTTDQGTTGLPLKELRVSSELLYKMVVVDGDKEILSKNLSYSSVATILMNLPDLAEYGDLYTVAAKHPSKQVRALVAQKETISAALCNVLANDASIDVLRCLTSNAPFRENATIELLEKLIERDVEIATEIAGNIEAYQRVDANKLAALISGHSDPEVLAALASYGSGAPTKALNALLTHPDPAVSNAAKSSLQDRGSE